MISIKKKYLKENFFYFYQLHNNFNFLYLQYFSKIIFDFFKWNAAYIYIFISCETIFQNEFIHVHDHDFQDHKSSRKKYFE